MRLSLRFILVVVSVVVSLSCCGAHASSSTENVVSGDGSAAVLNRRARSEDGQENDDLSPSSAVQSSSVPNPTPHVIHHRPATRPTVESSPSSPTVAPSDIVSNFPTKAVHVVTPKSKKGGLPKWVDALLAIIVLAAIVFLVLTYRKKHDGYRQVPEVSLNV